MVGGGEGGGGERSGGVEEGRRTKVEHGVILDRVG